jgi:hypothetical protein
MISLFFITVYEDRTYVDLDELANFLSDHGTYRHLLNTKRDHLILITQVNDTLISELISSGVITDESDFTENDVRLKLSHILQFFQDSKFDYLLDYWF